MGMRSHLTALLVGAFAIQAAVGDDKRPGVETQTHREYALTNWYVLGPIHPENVQRQAVQRDKAGTIRLLGRLLASASSTCPVDPSNGGLIALDGPSGTITSEAHNTPSGHTWRAMSLRKGGVVSLPADTDSKGVTYLSTWVHASTNMPARLHFGTTSETSKAAIMHVWVNSYGLRCKASEVRASILQRPMRDQDIYLREGWNHILCRHVVAWGQIHNSVSMNAYIPAKADVLLSHDPPDSVGRTFSFDGKSARLSAAMAPRALSARPSVP